ncbi:MAG: hypothetical protein WCC72_11030 [Dehalococcoidales bacterium]
MLNNNIVKRKNLSVIVLAFMVFVLAIVGFGCGTRTTVQLNNIPGTILSDGLAITNNTQWAWTNVQLTVNGSYNYSMEEINPQQTVNIVAKDFTHNGQSLDPSLLGAGTMLTGRCALPNNREGVFFIVWH